MRRIKSKRAKEGLCRIELDTYTSPAYVEDIIIYAEEDIEKLAKQALVYALKCYPNMDSRHVNGIIDEFEKALFNGRTEGYPW